MKRVVAGNAGYLITQDRHLLFLKKYAGIQIMTPEDILKSFNE